MNIERRIKRRKWILVGFGLYWFLYMAIIWFGLMSRDAILETRMIEFRSWRYVVPVSFCFGIVFSAMMKFFDQLQSKRKMDEDKKWMLLKINYFFRISSSKFWGYLVFGFGGLTMLALIIQRLLLFGFGRVPVNDLPFFHMVVMLMGVVLGMLFFDRKWIFQKNCDLRND
ncbi:MAG: hypothetical protein ACPGED_09225 [Flavobacteriales bacterium]